MTRKHYIEMAGDIFFALQQTSCPEDIAKLARDIADTLKRDNPAFSYVKFFSACGLNEWGELS